MILTTASIYGNVSSQMNNNPVQLKLSSKSNIENNTSIIFHLIHNSEIEFTNLSSSHIKHNGFNTTCSGNLDNSIHNYTCPQSNEILIHKCNGQYGILTSYCKVLVPSCSLINSYGKIDTTSAFTTTICTVLDYTKTSTTCQCTVQTIQSKRRLENTAMNGVVNLVSTSVYVARDIKDTFLSSGNLNSLESIQQVLIVIIMFSVLWASGLLLLFCCILRQRQQHHFNKKINVIEHTAIHTKNAVTYADVQKNLLSYITELFPAIYSNEPLARKIWTEISRHHRYLTLITAPKGESGDKQRILISIQLLSVQTMLMSLLSFLYNIQSPSDDGTCIEKRIEIDCLSRKSIFDSTQTYCAWVVSNSDDNSSCIFNQPKFSILTILFITVVVSIMTALISRPIDMIFELLSAPEADDVKIIHSHHMINSVGRRMSDAARKLSLLVVNSTNTALKKISKTNEFLNGVSSRKIPQNTLIAHELAISSMTEVAPSSLQKIQQKRLTQLRLYHENNNNHNNHNNNHNDNNHNDNDNNAVVDIDDNSSDDDDDSSDDNDSSDDERSDNIRTVVVRQSSLVDTYRKASIKEMIDENCTNKMIQLKDELNCQRKLLNSFDLEVFDRQWGIEPNLSIITSDYDGIQFKLGVYDKIHEQITIVKKDVYLKEAKMKITTDENVGLEILHLFIKDLLGKTTPAAKIFSSKADEDFEHTKVVTRLTKRLAILVLVVINVFFIYYSILIGFRRGISWQQSYLFACILQFIAEILFNETLECIWIQCVIPMLVKDEIRKVGDSITEIVNELCSQTQQDERLFLNAPDYLFVSTNLAKKFPDLMESIVVQSYFTHLPGEISKLWNTESYQITYNEHRILYKYRIIMFITTIFTILQYLGTAPFLVHRLFIRVIQPFAFGVIVFLWSP